MPELPEVEVVKRSLIKKTLNSIIKAVKINDARLRYKIDKKKIKKIIGLKIEKILRRSKYLLFYFNNDYIMLIHLGMTGKFFFVNEKNEKTKTSFYYDINEGNDKKHNHIIFNLSKNQKLIYNDVRKFGFIKLFKKSDLSHNFHLKKLGPEPLKNEFNLFYVKKYIVNRNRSVKDLLMDQKFVSGLGNIYVNEILFSSSVKPTRKIQKLSDKQIGRIIRNTKTILSKAINSGGSSIKDFSSSSGKKGSYQKFFNVYGKKGENCPKKNCSGKINKIVLANRATFYCSVCQK